MSAPEFKLPDDSQHTTIIGRTGSGKTQLAAFLLSQANFDEMPYIIVDYKGDALLNSVGAKAISIHADPPREPGLYIAHAIADADDEAMNGFLWKIYAQENTGIYFDEGFMVAKLPALGPILMQGRSKKIPCFIVSQRPSWMNRHAFSEASHFAVFHLNDRRDQMKVKEFFRNYKEDRIEKYHAQWYDVNQDENFTLQPVPNADTIRNTFVEKLEAMRENANRKRFV